MKKIFGIFAVICCLVISCFSFSGCGTTGEYAFDCIEMLGAEFSQDTVSRYLSRLTDAEKQKDAYVPILNLMNAFSIELNDKGKGNICISVTEELVDSLVMFTSESEFVEGTMDDLQDKIKDGQTEGQVESSQNLSQNNINSILLMLKKATVKIPFAYSLKNNDLTITLLELGEDSIALNIGEIINTFLVPTGFGVKVPDVLTGTLKDNKIEIEFKAAFPKIVRIDYYEDPDTGNNYYEGIYYEDADVLGLDATLTSVIYLSFEK